MRRRHTARGSRPGRTAGLLGRTWERGWAEDGLEGAWRAGLEIQTAIEGFSPMLIAIGHTRLGETDQAFRWLQRSYRERDPLMVILKADARRDSLRSDPRFQDLLRRIGFPES